LGDEICRELVVVVRGEVMGEVEGERREIGREIVGVQGGPPKKGLLQEAAGQRVREAGAAAQGGNGILGKIPASILRKTLDT
jgi:hypothetical protein